MAAGVWGWVAGAAVASAALMAGSAPGMAAEPAGLALVIGNGDYANVPALPACPASARLVAGRLRASGYEVIERTNLSNGASSAAFAAMTKALAAAPALPSLVYVCGYAASFDGRSFLLPVSAALERPGDVLTQGVAARAALGLAGAQAGNGLTLLDSIALPGASLDGMGALLTTQAPRPGRVVAAVSERSGQGAATPLAESLVAALRPGATISELAAEMRQGLAGRDLVLSVAGESPIPLLPAPPPPPPPAPPAAPDKPAPRRPAQPPRR